MDRDQNPVFLQVRDAIESVLAAHGFRLTREVFDHAAFGSAQVEYRHRAHWLRLSWDGKDRYLWLAGAVSPDQHVHPGPAAWHPLDEPSAPGTPALALEPGRNADIRIAQMLQQFESFLRSKAAV